MEAIGVGTATIKIISTDQKTGEKATAECMVTVLEAPTPDPAAKEDPVTVKPLEEDKLIPVESITIEPELFFIKMNEERQINVKIKPFNANAEDVIIKSYDSGSK